MVDIEMSSADGFDGCLLTVEKYCEKEIAELTAMHACGNLAIYTTGQMHNWTSVACMVYSYCYRYHAYAMHSYSIYSYVYS